MTQKGEERKRDGRRRKEQKRKEWRVERKDEKRIVATKK